MLHDSESEYKEYLNKPGTMGHYSAAEWAMESALKNIGECLSWAHEQFLIEREQRIEKIREHEETLIARMQQILKDNGNTDNDDMVSILRKNAKRREI